MDTKNIIKTKLDSEKQLFPSDGVSILNKIRHKPIILDSIFPYARKRQFVLIELISRDRFLETKLDTIYSGNEEKLEINHNFQKYKELENLKNKINILFENGKEFDIFYRKLKNLKSVSSINKIENKIKKLKNEIIELYIKIDESDPSDSDYDSDTKEEIESPLEKIKEKEKNLDEFIEKSRKFLKINIIYDFIFNDKLKLNNNSKDEKDYEIEERKDIINKIVKILVYEKYQLEIGYDHMIIDPENDYIYENLNLCFNNNSYYKCQDIFKNFVIYLKKNDIISYLEIIFLIFL